MSNKSLDFIGMPPQTNALPDGDKLSNTNRGNPNGDQVDNSNGANAVTQSIIDPKRQASGHSLASYAKPSWLYPSS
jgi:hypothetical protein